MNNNYLKQLVNVYNGAVKSYSIIFFSGNKTFGLMLAAVTFFNPVAGLCGLGAVLVTNLMARAAGFNRFLIDEGVYGFNSLLVGIGLGAAFEPGITLAAVVILASFLTLILSVCLAGALGKYNLPFLTLPFIFASWIMLLCAGSFPGLERTDRGIYWMNEMCSYGGPGLVHFFKMAETSSMPPALNAYLHSLSAIFFQQNVIAGALIAAGLLYFSRIAFSVSAIGFISAYALYHFLGADAAGINCQNFGFNFILTAIAMGSYYAVPSIGSYLLVILLVPLAAILIAASNAVFGVFSLPIYSLPFNFIVLSSLYALMLRQKPAFIELVTLQNSSPEENLYRHKNAVRRLGNLRYFHLQLPFMGEWMVQQGHDGSFTHKGEWTHAFDFIVTDAELKSYKGNEASPEDYYCYNKPLVSPADGFVEDISDNVEDTALGKVNLAQNWGNSIVLRHAPGFYTQLSHLKMNSFKVKKWDFVKKGDIVAACGSSGRSPAPHVHFQVQISPVLGSKTIDYPVAYYIKRTSEGCSLVSFGRPKEGELVSNVDVDSRLLKAFTFLPGQKLMFEFTEGGKPGKVAEWQVVTDNYNQSYLLCAETGARAYFVNDGQVFYFTGFYGNTKSTLFIFYLACYKILLGLYETVEISDIYPANILNRGLPGLLQDFAAPFYIFVKPCFRSSCRQAQDGPGVTELSIISRAEFSVLGRKTQNTEFNVTIKNDTITSIKIIKGGQTSCLTKIL